MRLVLVETTAEPSCRTGDSTPSFIVLLYLSPSVASCQRRQPAELGFKVGQATKNEPRRTESVPFLGKPPDGPRLTKTNGPCLFRQRAAGEFNFGNSRTAHAALLMMGRVIHALPERVKCAPQRPLRSSSFSETLLCIEGR